MADILCVYYSRTGKTRNTMTAIAEAMGAELVEISDGVDRRGFLGAVRSCFDAVRKSTRFLEPFTTEKRIEEYELIIIGTPIWAGRCCSVIREFLKKYGKKCRKTAFVITRSVEKDHQEQVFDQMTGYVPAPYICAASIRNGSVGETFWRDRFVRDLKEKMGRQLEKEEIEAAFGETLDEE